MGTNWLAVATTNHAMPGGTFVIVTVLSGTLGISQACGNKQGTYDYLVAK